MLTLSGNLFAQSAKQWTLKDCVDYALQNNIQLQKSIITKKSAQEDVLQSKSALLPSLNFSTSQNVTYRPWPESGSSTVSNGYEHSSVAKEYDRACYAVPANWSV